MHTGYHQSRWLSHDLLLVFKNEEEVSPQVSDLWRDKIALLLLRTSYRLILILTIADIIRSTWLCVFPFISLVHGPIESASSFCQAAGFLTQTGIEMAGKLHIRSSSISTLCNTDLL